MQLLCHFLAVWLFTFFQEGTAAYGAQNISINLHFVPSKCEINYIENLLRLIFILAFSHCVFFSSLSICTYVVLSGCAFEIHFKFTCTFAACGLIWIWKEKSFKVTRLPFLGILSKKLWLASINYKKNNSTLNLTDVYGLSISMCATISFWASFMSATK